MKKSEVQVKVQVKVSNIWDSIATRGVNKVIKLREFNTKQDEIRKQYGADVMKAVVFGTAHELKEDFMEDMEKLSVKFEGTLPRDSISDTGEYIYCEMDLANIAAAKRMNQ